MHAWPHRPMASDPWRGACRGEKLWVPTNNESQRNNDFVTKHFPSFARFQSVYLEREDGGDVLTPEAFDKALSIHQQVLDLQWSNLKDQDNPDSGKVDETLPATVKLVDLCLNSTSGEGVGSGDVLDCVMSNPIELFGYGCWPDRKGSGTCKLQRLGQPVLFTPSCSIANIIQNLGIPVASVKDMDFSCLGSRPP